MPEFIKKSYLCTPMDIVDGYIVDLKGMKDDAVSHHWVLSDDFFSAVQGDEIKHGQVDVALRVKRTSEAFELDFQYEGMVEVECDRCLELMNQPIQGQCSLRAKMGEEDDDDGELITVAESSGILNLEWHLYEMVALEIPIRHVHSDGECNDKVMECLNPQETEKPVDPRWAALEALKTKTNKK
ncbi:MAG: DUF177 domain-containing protein [Bacteroidaceae bacterium]|nr:DUF177 domain-containing protein [Bacteroidaceae bacterium]